MSNQNIKWLVAVLALVIVVAAVLLFTLPNKGTVPATDTATSTAALPAGVSEYTDKDFGVSFWYPSTLMVTATSAAVAEFPGAASVKEFQVGAQGDVMVYEVVSANGAITDEPDNHASPISQTKYFYDSASASWMAAYPEGATDGSNAATTTASVKDTTVGNLPMLPSGRRFDTTIIPLSSTKFIVVTTGGGAPGTPLAKTVSAVGADVDQAALSAALSAELSAYAE